MGGVGRNGTSLRDVHGGPARLLVPYLCFWKSAKWVSRLRLTDHDEPGLWEQGLVWAAPKERPACRLRPAAREEPTERSQFRLASAQGRDGVRPFRSQAAVSAPSTRTPQTLIWEVRILNSSIRSGSRPAAAATSSASADKARRAL